MPTNRPGAPARLENISVVGSPPGISATLDGEHVDIGVSTSGRMKLSITAADVYRPEIWLANLLQIGEAAQRIVDDGFETRAGGSIYIMLTSLDF